ncbi:MAG: Gfo/Idh/MocA family oxidoreductase [Verrucomicrobiota bacterium]
MKSENRRRYVICGLSTRSVVHFLLPLLGVKSGFSSRDFSGVGEVVGILDIDPDRVAAMNRQLGREIPFFAPEEFDRMVAETRPDVVLVGARDCDHATYILSALKHDLEVVAEKPMVTTSEDARAVLAAERAGRGNVRVAFNVRYNPRMIAAKRFIQNGGLGNITSLTANFSIDTKHGSSYFYRWNRERRFSGGLSIHKESHHFDLLSWLIGDRAEKVFAFGKLNYYGPDGLLRPRDEAGNAFPPEEEKRRCPYFQKHLASQFAPSENPATRWDPLLLPYDKQYPASESRYIYDAEIDIEDTYSAVIRYRGGASLSLGVTFCAPFSGHQICINGSKGRLQIDTLAQPFARENGFERPPGRKEFRFYPLFGGAEDLVITTPNSGGHGGADELIQEDMFNGGKGNTSLEGLGCYSGSLDGAYAVVTGEAVWRSVVEERPFTIRELLGEFAEG